MCKSTEQYMKYDQCLLSPGKGIAGQISSHLSSRPNMQHHIKTKVIHLCRAARERPDQSRCSVIQDLVEGAVLEEPAFSSYAGPCPACEAAQNATNQTIIVNNRDSPPAVSGTGEEAAADPAQPPPRSGKKEKGHKSSKKKSKK